jgi:NAD(P)-dependent dehydrogenase (short-subunit alcohol dehydrogenase family)
MELKGKKTLVIGASRGIGEAIAVTYAKEGADVVICGRNAEKLKPCAAKINQSGGKAFILEWDIKDISRAAEIMSSAAEFLGGLDVVVNNAGVIDHVPPLKVPESEWDNVIDTNLKGVYFSCQAAANYMIEKGIKGRIINIASETGTQPAIFPYAISKWGVLGFSMGMARYLYKFGVTLSSIAPGPIATDMMGWSEGKPMEFPNAFGTLGDPMDVANVAVFLASDKSRRVAGRPIFVSGGLNW